MEWSFLLRQMAQVWDRIIKQIPDGIDHPGSAVYPGPDRHSLSSGQKNVSSPKCVLKEPVLSFLIMFQPENQTQNSTC